MIDIDTAFWALPAGYFASIATPFRDGVLTLIPALGVVCLAIGLAFGFVARALWCFGLLILASQVLVAIADIFHGAVQQGHEAPLIGFLVLQIVAAGYLVYRLKRARMAAALLATFTSSYALYAAFVASLTLCTACMF